MGPLIPRKFLLWKSLKESPAMASKLHFPWCLLLWARIGVPLVELDAG
jgi:hypothetical protein